MGPPRRRVQTEYQFRRTSARLQPLPRAVTDYSVDWFALPAVLSLERSGAHRLLHRIDGETNTRSGRPGGPERQHRSIRKPEVYCLVRLEAVLANEQDCRPAALGGRRCAAVEGDGRTPRHGTCLVFGRARQPTDSLLDYSVAR